MRTGGLAGEEEEEDAEDEEESLAPAGGGHDALPLFRNDTIEGCF